MRNLKASAIYFRYVNVLKSRRTQIAPFPFNIECTGIILFVLCRVSHD